MGDKARYAVSALLEFAAGGLCVTGQYSNALFFGGLGAVNLHDKIRYAAIEIYHMMQ